MQGHPGGAQTVNWAPGQHQQHQHQLVKWWSSDGSMKSCKVTWCHVPTPWEIISDPKLLSWYRDIYVPYSETKAYSNHLKFVLTATFRVLRSYFDGNLNGFEKSHRFLIGFLSDPVVSTASQLPGRRTLRLCASGHRGLWPHGRDLRKTSEKRCDVLHWKWIVVHTWNNYDWYNLYNMYQRHIHTISYNRGPRSWHWFFSMVVIGRWIST